MDRVRSALRSPPVGASAAFLIAALLLAAGFGSYLALHPSAGSYTGPPLTFRGRVKGSAGYHFGLIRGPQGVWFDIGTGYPSLPTAPPGTLIGGADFTVTKDESGWPRRTHVEWDLTLDHIESVPGGPTAGDESEWRRLIAEALGRSFPGRYDLPALILSGGDHGTSWYPRAFILNAGDRLWHAPRWLICCAGLAVFIALIVGFILHRHPRRAPGACRKCGYDLRGLDGGVCPECGAPAA